MAGDREGDARATRGQPADAESMTTEAGTGLGEAMGSDPGAAGPGRESTPGASRSFYARAAERASRRGAQQESGSPTSGRAPSDPLPRETGGSVGADAQGAMGLPGPPDGGFESGYRDAGAKIGSDDLNRAETSDAPEFDDASTVAGGTDLSAELGLGYRDYGMSTKEAEGAGDGPDTRAGRRARWQREPAAARDIMTKNPRAVRRGAGIREIAQIMRDEGTGIVPVVEESGQLLGVVTDRDIVMRALAEGRNPLELTASDVMTDDVEAVTPEESLRGVVDLMGNKQIRRVPVVDQDDRLVGIISMGDVATRADYDEDLQDALEEISAQRSFWSGIFG